MFAVRCGRIGGRSSADASGCLLTATIAPPPLTEIAIKQH